MFNHNVHRNNASTVVDPKPNQFSTLFGFGKNQVMNDSNLFPKARRLPQHQRTLARKYNKISDEIEHGHTKMFA